MPAKLIHFRAEASASEGDRVVSQDELTILLDDQEAAWRIFSQAHLDALAIRDRLAAGATIESGDISFDFELCKATRRPSAG